jgi:hypothetical protein
MRRAAITWGFHCQAFEAIIPTFESWMVNELTKNVLIFGSCVSRDIFNIEYSRGFKVSNYYARSSFASLVGKAYDNDTALNNISSKFQRSMVSNDFSKEVLTAGAKIDKADIILIDFIDERYDLVVFPSGEMITKSDELATSRLLKEPGLEFRLVKQGSAERREYWLQGIRMFFDLLKAHNKLNRVLVNKAYWATEFEGKTDTVYPVDRHKVDEANRDLDWMYDALRNDIREDQFLTFQSGICTASESHRWGISPFHYGDRYYKDALLQLIRKSHQFMSVGHSPLRVQSPLVSPDLDISVSGYVDRGEVVAECSLSSRGEGCDASCFAFYLYVDGVRQDVRWYQSSNSVRFRLPSLAGKLQVRAFYQDVYGNGVNSWGEVN